MMERLALEQFKAWKDIDKGKRKPLLVTVLGCNIAKNGL